MGRLDPETHFEAESRVDEVSVYARGAIVRRVVEPPKGQPSDRFELAIPGLPITVERGSLRATVQGGRTLVGLRLRTVIPAGKIPVPSGLEAEQRILESDVRVMAARLEEFTSRAKLLRTAIVDPRLKKKANSSKPSARIADALAVEAFLKNLRAELDGEMIDLQSRLEDAQRRKNELAVRIQQATSGELASSDQPTCTAVAEFAPGAGAVSGLTLEYAVECARWWPAYTARVGTDGVAKLALEAFVAQSTEEDWSNALLSVCTADMVRNIDLPKLQALRLGKARAPRPSGYRSAPDGLQALFADYEHVIPSQGRVASAKPTPKAKPAPPPAQAPRPQSLTTGQYAPHPAPAEAPAGGGMPYLESGAIDPSRSPAPGAPERRARRRGGAVAKSARFQSASPALEQAASNSIAAVGPSGIEPEANWLDFDSLILGSVDSRTERGRLKQRPRTPAVRPGAMTASRLAGPKGVKQPGPYKGHFDCRYGGSTRVDVPSNGKAHRVPLAIDSCECESRFRCAPGRDSGVYREVTLRNPFDLPLLAGPLEVFLDGAFLTRGALPIVDRGGLLTLGLGCEERLRVARNVRLTEENKGLLGGKTRVEHHVTLDFASSLGFPVTVDLVEAIPTNDDDDDDIEITMVSESQPSNPYDQSDRTDPIEGGLIWQVELGAGEKTQLSYSYRIDFSSKFELEGGNHRG